MVEPLTPPDCDLRGLPFMPLDVVRLLDSDLFALSSGDEFKAAVALWAKAWTQVPAASLPDEDRILSHLSGTGRAWKKLKNMALRGFVLCSDGRWYHPVIAEKAKEAWAHRLKQRQKAAMRWDREKPERGIAAGHAAASATAMQGTGTGTGNTPLEESNGVTAQRGSRLPDGFEMPDDWLQWAMGERHWSHDDAFAEGQSFADYWRAKPGKDGRKLDWQATWRNWVRSARRPGLVQREPLIPI